MEDLGQKLESLRKEVDKNASFIIFGQSFAVKADIAETILGEKLFSGEFDRNCTQITVRISYGKQHNYTFSVSEDTGRYKHTTAVLINKKIQIELNPSNSV